MSITILDISRAAGVSTATVSRVLNGSELVKPDTSKRVNEVVRSMNYQPNHAAQALAARNTKLIGVIFPEIHSGFYTEVLRGIDDIAFNSRYSILTAFAHGIDDERDKISNFLNSNRVDALILVNLNVSSTFLMQNNSGKTPIVSINRSLIGDGMMSVVVENRHGADDVMSHYIEHGYKRIAVLTGPKDNDDSNQRLEGCFNAIDRMGLNRDSVHVWQGAFTEESGKMAAEQYLSDNKNLPEAIFALNDSMALGILDWMNDHGLRVPDDVALAGFDDCEVAKYVGLTTVKVPMRELGQQAGKVVIDALNDKFDDPHVLDTCMVVRNSCGCKQS